MTESTKAFSAGSLSRHEAARLALTAALSEGLALGFFDVSLSLSHRPAGAPRHLRGPLATVAASGGAFFFVILITPLPFSLLPPRTPRHKKGALLSALATGMGTVLGV